MNPKILLAISLLIVSCQQKAEFQTHPSGLQYKIIPSGYGNPVEPGQFLKLHIRQLYNDSILSDTRNTIPQYQPFDSTQLSPESYSIFGQVHSGDSLVFKLPADSAFKTKRPPFAKSGGWLFTYVKVIGIIRSDTEAKADLEQEQSMRYPKDPSEMSQQNYDPRN
jgi:hypothetical protein